MDNKYKLYPINSFILLGENESQTAELYKMGSYFKVSEKPILTINKNQCTRIIRKFGKNYYRIERS